MDSFAGLVEDIPADADLPGDSTKHDYHATLPGFYRAEKGWDTAVVHNDELLAVVECISQASSFGDNLNNRVEEAVGTLTGLWEAYEEGLCEPSPAPWIGYPYLMADNENSQNVPRLRAPKFDVDDEFQEATYPDRVELLRPRMVRQRLVDAPAFILSEEDRGMDGDYWEPNEELGFERFARSLVGHVQAYVESDYGYSNGRSEPKPPFQGLIPQYAPSASNDLGGWSSDRYPRQLPFASQKIEHRASVGHSWTGPRYGPNERDRGRGREPSVRTRTLSSGRSGPLHVGRAERRTRRDLPAVFQYQEARERYRRNGSTGWFGRLRSSTSRSIVWGQCYERLAPGGRMCVVAGDVLRSRSDHGRHRVLPLHATIREHCTDTGFDNLAPIIRYKIGNASLEAGGNARFPGKPSEPGAVIKTTSSTFSSFESRGISIPFGREENPEHNRGRPSSTDVSAVVGRYYRRETA